MILNPPERTAQKFIFLHKNDFSYRKCTFPQKNDFPAEKCTFLQKNVVLGGHIAGNRRKSHEGLRAQESRTLANFHKIVAGDSAILRPLGGTNSAITACRFTIGARRPPYKGASCSAGRGLLRFVAGNFCRPDLGQVFLEWFLFPASQASKTKFFGEFAGCSKS